MACTLTTGFLLDCRDSVGGIINIYITELTNKATLSESTEGFIDVFTLNTGTQFFKYEGVKQTSNTVENLQSDDPNGTVFFEQDILLIINKQRVEVRNEIKLLAQNNLMIIAEDRNGFFWLYGEVNGTVLDPSVFNSGTAFGDRNGYELNFKGFEEDLASQVDPALIPVLTAPAA